MLCGFGFLGLGLAASKFAVNGYREQGCRVEGENLELPNCQRVG